MEATQEVFDSVTARKAQEAALVRLKKLEEADGKFWVQLVKFAATTKMLGQGLNGRTKSQLANASGQFMVAAIREVYKEDDEATGRRLDKLMDDSGALLDDMIGAVADDLKARKPQ